MATTAATAYQSGPARGGRSLSRRGGGERGAGVPAGEAGGARPAQAVRGRSSITGRGRRNRRLTPGSPASDSTPRTRPRRTALSIAVGPQPARGADQGQMRLKSPSAEAAYMHAVDGGETAEVVDPTSVDGGVEADDACGPPRAWGRRAARRVRSPESSSTVTASRRGSGSGWAMEREASARPPAHAPTATNSGGSAAAAATCSPSAPGRAEPQLGRAGRPAASGGSATARCRAVGLERAVARRACPGFGRKLSRSQARTTVDQIAPTRAEAPDRLGARRGGDGRAGRAGTAAGPGRAAPEIRSHS